MPRSPLELLFRKERAHPVGPAVPTDDAARQLGATGLDYLPLEVLSPGHSNSCAFARSSASAPPSTPSSASSTRHSPPRPYRACSTRPTAPSRRTRARLLGQPALTVLKGGGGEFERHPAKAVELFGLRGGADWSGLAPALADDTRRLADDSHEPADLVRLWDGTLADPFAAAIVTGTAALALETAGV
jgi:hypothetical protein